LECRLGVELPAHERGYDKQRAYRQQKEQKAPACRALGSRMENEHPCQDDQQGRDDSDLGQKDL
jgi:hypothetical protein